MNLQPPTLDILDSRLRLGAWAALLVSAAVLLGRSQAAESDHPFRYVFSTSVLREVNENDARAAMKVWVGSLVKEGTVRADPNVAMFSKVGEIRTALQSGAADGAAVVVNELDQLREQVLFNRYVFGVMNGSIWEEYVVLVRQESPLAKLEDLQGRSLNLFQNSRMSLALIWLDTLLLQQGQPAAAVLCRKITPQAKLIKAVLPVFFHQTDACLITRTGFITLGELNPQVTRQLRVLAVSPKLVSGGIFFRTGYPQAQQDEMVAQLQRMHQTPGGQQVLTIFQTDRLEEHPLSVLNSAFELMETHRRLCAATNRAPISASRLHVSEPKTN